MQRARDVSDAGGRTFSSVSRLRAPLLSVRATEVWFGDDKLDSGGVARVLSSDVLDLRLWVERGVSCAPLVGALNAEQAANLFILAARTQTDDAFIAAVRAREGEIGAALRARLARGSPVDWGATVLVGACLLHPSAPDALAGLMGILGIFPQLTNSKLRDCVRSAARHGTQEALCSAVRSVEGARLLLAPLAREAIVEGADLFRLYRACGGDGSALLADLYATHADAERFATAHRACGGDLSFLVGKSGAAPLLASLAPTPNGKESELSIALSHGVTWVFRDGAYTPCPPAEAALKGLEQFFARPVTDGALPVWTGSTATMRVHIALDKAYGLCGSIAEGRKRLWRPSTRQQGRLHTYLRVAGQDYPVSRRFYAALCVVLKETRWDAGRFADGPRLIGAGAYGCGVHPAPVVRAARGSVPERFERRDDTYPELVLKVLDEAAAEDEKRQFAVVDAVDPDGEWHVPLAASVILVAEELRHMRRIGCGAGDEEEEEEEAIRALSTGYGLYMEYGGKTLYEICRTKLVDAALLQQLRPLFVGIRDARKHGFAHMDIKSDNVVVDKRARLIDFGLSGRFSGIVHGWCFGSGDVDNWSRALSHDMPDLTQRVQRILHTGPTGEHDRDGEARVPAVYKDGVCRVRGRDDDSDDGLLFDLPPQASSLEGEALSSYLSALGRGMEIVEAEDAHQLAVMLLAMDTVDAEEVCSAVQNCALRLTARPLQDPVRIFDACIAPLARGAAREG